MDVNSFETIDPPIHVRTACVVIPILVSQWDLYNATEIIEECKLAAGNASKVVLDVSQVRMISSTGFSVLLRYAAELQQAGCQLYMAEPALAVQKVAKFARLGDLEAGPIRLRATVDVVLQELGQGESA